MDFRLYIWAYLNPIFMLKRFFKVVSVVFHPLFMPLMLFGLTCFLGSFGVARYGFKVQMYFALGIFLFSFVVPSISVSIFVAFGMVKSAEMSGRHERHLPYLVGVLSMATLYYLLARVQVHFLISLPILGSVMAGCGLLLLNFFFKISAHTTCVGAVLGFLAAAYPFFRGDVLLVFMVAVAIAGMVGTARLYLNAHSATQVWCGYALGASSMFLVLKVGAWFL